MVGMVKKHNPNPAGARGIPVSLAPLRGDDALAVVLRIKPEDVKKIQAATPGKKKSRKQ
jgi:hypothetical protein